MDSDIRYALRYRSSICCSDLGIQQFKVRGLMEREPGSSRPDRKTTEKNRRNRMKALLSELHSLVPPQTRPRELTLSVPDQLGEAADYIKSLQVSVGKMREQKEKLLEIEKINKTMENGPIIRFKSPEIRIQNNGPILEVVLVTGLDGQFMFNEIVRVIHVEGATIVNASFSNVGDTMVHTIHAKVGDGDSSDERISERLRKIVNDTLMEFHQ